jgi:hypothetical protein
MVQQSASYSRRERAIFLRLVSLSMLRETSVKHLIAIS